MPTPITMPQLGESVTEGVVARWLKAEGDHVERDELLLEIITDKVNAEMPSPVAGTLVKIVAPEGATIPVGGEIARIEVESAVGAASPAAPVSIPAPAASAALVEAAAGSNGAAPSNAASPSSMGEASMGEADTGEAGEERRRYSPVVKRLAREHDIDLARVGGTGLSGRVTKDDVLGYIAGRQSQPASTAAAESTAPAAPALAAESTASSTVPEMAATSAPLTPAPSTTAEPVTPPLGATLPSRPAPPLAGNGNGAGNGPTRPFDRMEALEAGLDVSAPSPAPPTTTSGTPAASADEEYIPLTPMRKAIAEHMVRSKHTAPHATTTIEVDMTRLVRWRARNKEAVRARHGVDITYVPLMMHAVVDALKAFPILNASWGDDRIILKRRINLGLAVGLDDGLVVPVVRDADEKSVVGLARAVADLSARARANRLTLQDIQGGTFTVNNTGVFGAIVTTPVINQPQAAILAMNAIVKRPVVIEDDAIAVRSIMTLSLSFDHRIVDGLTAGRFMQRVVHNVDRLDPSTL